MTEQDIVAELLNYFKETYPHTFKDKESFFSVENNLLSFVMKLGKELISLLLKEKGSGYSDTKINKNNCEYIYKGNIEKSIHSLFGKIQIKRARYIIDDTSRSDCPKAIYPLDKELGIELGHTPACQYFVTKFTGSDVYLEGISRFNEIFRSGGADCISTKKAIDMTNHLGLMLEKKEQEKIGKVMAGQNVEKVDTVKNMAVFIDACKTPEKAVFEDEKGNKKHSVQYRDAKIISVAERSWDNKKQEVVLNKITHAAATEHADEFLKRGYTKLIERGKEKIKTPIVFVADGADWIWDRVPMIAEHRVEILDFYHATEHAAKCSKIIYGEGNDVGQQQYQQWVDEIYCGKVTSLIGKLLEHKKKYRGEKRKKLDREIKYFQRHKNRMKYDVYRMNNYPIGSGTVESACKNVVACRMKRTGMKWSKTGTTAMLNIRASLKSNRFIYDFKTCILRDVA